MKQVLSIVPHTHWDREWYQTFQGFRHRLVRLVDKLLRVLDTDPKFRCFNLDGQTVVLEDYLEIRPENRARLKRYIRQGRIMIGPWYILPDEFLVSGESFVRNLMFGNRMCGEFGRRMNAGYLPDQFGHSAAIPKIVAGAGIDSAVVWRGVTNDVRHSEFAWQGDDGTRVLGIYLAHSYGNGMDLPMQEDKLFERLDREAKALSRYARTNRLLIMNGVDHQEPQEGLPQSLEKIRKRLKRDYEIMSLEKHVRGVQSRIAMKRLKVHRGEFRSHERAQLLPGVLSTRVNLKQRSDQLEIDLPGKAEPLCSLAHASGASYPASYLNLAWRELLRNHPHDSICGCSVDAVHREMETRFSTSEDIVRDVVNDASEFLIEKSRGFPSEPRVIVFNPGAGSRTEAVEVKTAEGKTVRFTARDIPGFGYRSFRLGEAGAQWGGEARASEKELSNEFFSVKLNRNGTIDITDRTNGRTFRNQGAIEETGDVGDEYNYSPAPGGGTFRTPVSVKWRVVENGGPRAVVKAVMKFRFPAEINPDRKTRSRREVACTLRNRIALAAGVPRVEFETVIENAARDHRVRALFPLPFRIDHSRAFNHFGTVDRAARTPVISRKAPEVHIGTYPNLGYVQAGRSGYSVTLSNIGLREYEILNCNTIALTLLRCVGWLSRGDFAYRKGNAGPQVPSPDAQMLGVHTLKYAFCAGKGFLPVEQASLFRTGVISRYVAAGRGDGPLPGTLSVLGIEPAEVALAALKRAEDGKGLIVRVFSLAEKEMDASIEFYRDFREAFGVNLLEERKGGAKVSVSGRTIRFRVRPNQVVSARILL